MAYCGLKDWAKAKEDGLKCVQMKPDFVKGYHRAATAMINLVVQSAWFDRRTSSLRPRSFCAVV